MTHEDIIKWAVESGYTRADAVHGKGEVYTRMRGVTYELQRFAELVAAHEREECAKVCEAQVETGAHIRCAAAIRARKS